MTSVIVEELPVGHVTVTLPSDTAVTIELPGDPYPLVEVSAARGPKGDTGDNGINGTNGKTILPPLCITGNVTVQTGVARLYNDTGIPLSITKVRASVGTAPTGSSLDVDVRKNGTSIFGIFKPRILAGANTGVQVPPATTFADGDYLTVDVTAIGSTLPGANLVVTIATA
jgi:hypothetical protein